MIIMPRIAARRKNSKAFALQTPKEIRRSAVTSLLEQGIDLKVLMGGGDDGAKILKDAYDLARKNGPLGWPFPQITAYRLAYILMRNARTRKELQRIEALLAEAGEGETIDPLQHALHIVAIERLRDLAGKPSEREKLRQRSAYVFEKLPEASRKADRTPTSRPVQDDLFNLVELCGFLVGSDLSQLVNRRGVWTPIGVVRP